MDKLILSNEEELVDFAKKLAKKTKPAKENARVFALSGELGSGKTTFSKGFLKQLKVKEQVISPTFLIIKSYPLKGSKFKQAYHIDTYRLENPAEILNLGLEEILDNKANLVLIEWAEKVEKYLPKDSTWIKFSHYDKGRLLEIENE
ncbi:MAG: tRNA (adenosine(37)-N6)-threonylcarbamoyltransferase complex ATPase subunit type 1 TsaE [bacterium]|nr:tRNA (adenosine(37)-N6)-threonylcarbamoyltransferase complex ATPase subunit type 1 TsaE [bacterium]